MIELKVFLVRNGLNQTVLAEGIGVTTAAVSQWFSGANNPSKETIDAILSFCRQYDPAVTYEDLFGAPLPLAAGE